MTRPSFEAYGIWPPGFDGSSQSVPSKTSSKAPPLSVVSVTTVPDGEVRVTSRSAEFEWATEASRDSRQIAGTDPARDVDRRGRRRVVEDRDDRRARKAEVPEDAGRVREGGERKRPSAENPSLAGGDVADAERPDPVRVFADERAQGLFRRERRGRHAGLVGVVGDEPVVLGVGNLAGGIGLVIPDGPVEDVGVQAAVAARQRHDRSRRAR